uniref:Tumor protein p73 n=1 Tax=Macaca fascicularis TaxID=9541 RepID=A0A7N9CIQ5_MACFA
MPSITSPGLGVAPLVSRGVWSLGRACTWTPGLASLNAPPASHPGAGMLNNHGHAVPANGEMSSSHSTQSMVSGSHCTPPPPYHADPSLVSFLTGLGCPNCIEYFTSQGLQSIYHLQNLTIEDLGALKIPEQYRMTIWRGLQDLKQGHDYGAAQQLLRSATRPPSPSAAPGAAAPAGHGGRALRRHTITIPNRGGPAPALTSGRTSASTCPTARPASSPSRRSSRRPRSTEGPGPARACATAQRPRPPPLSFLCPKLPPEAGPPGTSPAPGEAQPPKPPADSLSHLQNLLELP